MTKRNYTYLIIIIITFFALSIYWVFDSYWSVFIYKENLKYLIHHPPLSLMDTITFKVSPYQGVARAAVSIIIFSLGLTALIISYFKDKMVKKIKKAEDEKMRLLEVVQRAKRMETVGLMAGGVAHDLNNVLSGVTTYPEMLLLGMSEDDPMRGPLVTIYDAGQKAADIVKDLSTLSSGGVDRTQIIDLNYLIQEFVSSPVLVRYLPRHKYVKVMPFYSKKKIYIRGSEMHIYKIIMNLTINAINSIAGDTGLVKITTKLVTLKEPIDKYISVRKGQYALISIEDTGRGIHEKDLDHIFEPFFTKNKLGINGSGTGLGLTIVWAAIHEHAGYISVESSSAGTKFDVYLPAEEHVSIEDKSPLYTKKYMGEGQKILVVDDNKSQRRILSTLLKTLNYKVETAGSGEEAIGILKSGKKFDLMILDVLMPPGMNGCDTYREAVKINPDQRAIIASGYIDSSKVKSAMKLGISYFIHKPYSIYDISEKIHNTLTNGKECL